MPTLVLRFPGGRYHATPGGHHVNEGLVEWPPSPWRLIRALIACGYATQHWAEVPSEGKRLIHALCRALPEFRLPPAALGHSRHYMPIGRGTALVFDTFAHLGDGQVWVRWPTELDEEARRLFERLATCLGYLGRSESWVVAEPVADDVLLPETGRAFPHMDGTGLGQHCEQITLTAPYEPVAYDEWRRREVAVAIGRLQLPPGRKPTKAHQKKIHAAESVYPLDIVDCLQRDTAWWQRGRWSQPPGARQVLYWREAGALEVWPVSPPRVSGGKCVEVMLLALTTPNGSRSALPPLVRTLPQAELIHRALVSKLGFDGAECPELTGRDRKRLPLKGHRHAHLLPVDLDHDGRLDHIVVFAPMGLRPRAQQAVRSVQRTYQKGGVGALRVAVAGAGALRDVRAIGAGLTRGVQELLGPAEGARSWISATPFVPPRHLKRHGRSSLAGQVQAELAERGFPPASVEVLEWTGETSKLRHFMRRRQRGAPPPIDAGFAVRLRFDEPVFGPICLGYASHFGLGRFSAEDEQLLP